MGSAHNLHAVYTPDQERSPAPQWYTTMLPRQYTLRCGGSSPAHRYTMHEVMRKVHEHRGGLYAFVRAPASHEMEFACPHEEELQLHMG